MVRLVGRRLLLAVPMLLILVFFIFVLLDLTPGDPAALLAGENAGPEQIEAARERLGLNDGLVSRYFDYLSGLLHGNLGTSLFSGRYVVDVILETIPVTLCLVFGALLFAIVVGVPSAILAAMRQDTWFDRTASATASAATAAPPFAIGLLLITVMAVQRDWFPVGGYVPFSEDPAGWARCLFLPCLALAVDPAAELFRQTRGAMIDVLRKDYMQTAVSLGLSKRQIVLKYALRNAAVPVVTVLGLQAARVFGGAAVIELIFTLPGLGTEAMNAVFYHDYPMIQGIILVSGLTIILLNTFVDASYGLIDPRNRR